MIVVKNKLVVFLLFFSMVFSFLNLPISYGFATDENLDISVVVVQKIELLSVVSLLSRVDDYYACDRLNTVIKRDAVAWFSPYKNNQAVKTFLALINQDQTESTLRKYIMELGDLPDLSLPEDLPLEFRDTKFSSFRNELVSFCQDSNFLTFWCREKEYYDQMVDEFSVSCLVKDSLDKEMAFLGSPFVTCLFVISPLMMENQVMLLDSLPQKTGFILLGLSDIQNGRLQFGTNQTHLNLVQGDFLKELIISVSKQFEQDISKSKSLYIPIQKKMEENQIMSWQDCFNQHLIRSIQILCFESNESEKLTELKKLGFIYIDDSYHLLKQYMNYRSYYRSLKTFLPRIMDQFEAIARRNQ